MRHNACELTFVYTVQERPRLCLRESYLGVFSCTCRIVDLSVMYSERKKHDHPIDVAHSIHFCLLIQKRLRVLVLSLQAGNPKAKGRTQATGHGTGTSGPQARPRKGEGEDK